MYLVNFRKMAFLLLFFASSTVMVAEAQDKFPVPSGNPNQLFYLQRTPNTNTIVCELNYKNGILDPDEPIHVFWLRFTDQGQKEELNFIQRKFAYGIKSQLVAKDRYELNFVSYKKYPMYLMKGSNNKYNVYGTINQKQAIVNRIFVKINGGSFWQPNVEYVEIKGVDPSNGKEVIERRKI
jgi:hypothetical protein